jgi:adenylate kinase family enzyme
VEKPLRKLVIFGNSGSGKSTLAKGLAGTEGLRHLDLDTLAWLPGSPPERKPLAESRKEIEHFLGDAGGWVVEGCYSDLLEMVVPGATEIIFLDLPVEECRSNARLRPWEPHKYASKEAQDENLEMLLEWIGQYDDRTDCFSRDAHERLFHDYTGKKTRYTSNRREAR